MSKVETKVRGVYERTPGDWWIRYADAAGKIRREKAGAKNIAIKLVDKRRSEVLQGKKLPESLRKKAVTFADLAKDALEFSKAHKLSYDDDVIRMKKLTAWLADRPAEAVTPQDIERWFGTHEKWKPATANRYRAMLSLTYKLGIQNGKIATNPARLVRQLRENNARDRYLLPEEETRLRTAIEKRWPQRLPEIDIAINTGMRRSEQFNAEWSNVDLDNAILTVPRSKHGEKRYVYLNDAALAAFQTLWRFSKGKGRVFAYLYDSVSTKGAREWFEMALTDAGISNFRWHDLRHTFGSRLVMAGVDIYMVSKLMGHKTITVTMRYAHLAPQHQLAAVQRLCNTIGATDTTTDTSGRERSVARSATTQ